MSFNISSASFGNSSSLGSLFGAGQSGQGQGLVGQLSQALGLNPQQTQQLRQLVHAAKAGDPQAQQALQQLLAQVQSQSSGQASPDASAAAPSADSSFQAPAANSNPVNLDGQEASGHKHKHHHHHEHERSQPVQANAGAASAAMSAQAFLRQMAQPVAA